MTTVMTERIQMQSSTYRQNYVVYMSLCQLYQIHGIIAEVHDVIKQFESFNIIGDYTTQTNR